MATEINFIEYIKVVSKWKKVIGLVVGGMTLGTVVVSLLLAPLYKASATLTIVGGQKADPLSGIAGQFGFGSLLLSSNSSSSQIMSLLKSRTLAERVIENNGLVKIFYKDLWDEKKQAWKNPDDLPPMLWVVKDYFSFVRVNEDKRTGLISIDAQFSDPETASDLANIHIQEVSSFLQEKTFTAAKRNRIFVGGQLEKNKAELLESSKKINAFYADNKVSNVVTTVDVGLASEDALDATEGSEDPSVSGVRPEGPQLHQLPVGGNAAHTGLGDGFPIVGDAFADTAEKVQVLQKKAEEVDSKIRRVTVVKDVPQQVYLQYLVLRREILGKINGLLTQQYEMAKIEESKNDINFQVIDWARPPIERTKPRRRQMVTRAFCASLFFGVLLAFVLEYMERNKTWQTLRQVLPTLIRSNPS